LAHTRKKALPGTVFESELLADRPECFTKHAKQQEEGPNPLVIMDSDTKHGGSDPSAATYSSLDDSVQTTPVAVGVQMAPPVMVVTAVAPADLPAGYRFTVIDDDNRAVVVEVVR
jgi:hypothetical protein